MRDKRRVQKLSIQQKGHFHRLLTFFRTVANPSYLDPRMDASARPLGTIFAPDDPMLSNWGWGRPGRVLTPRSWLSTWSGPSSRAEFLETIGDVTLPTLILAADGDTETYPAQQQQLLDASGPIDKELQILEQASHFLTPLSSVPNTPNPRERAADILVAWIRERLS
jgi:pimeloyl-ACP methyl ester carboxylesterase